MFSSARKLPWRCRANPAWLLARNPAPAPHTRRSSVTSEIGDRRGSIAAPSPAARPHVCARHNKPCVHLRTTPLRSILDSFLIIPDNIMILLISSGEFAFCVEHQAAANVAGRSSLRAWALAPDPHCIANGIHRYTPPVPKTVLYHRRASKNAVNVASSIPVRPPSFYPRAKAWMYSSMRRLILWLLRADSTTGSLEPRPSTWIHSPLTSRCLR